MNNSPFHVNCIFLLVTVSLLYCALLRYYITYQGRTQDFRRGARRGGGREEGGGVPRSAKEANKPNKRATGLKPRTCAHQGSMFRP